MKIFIIIFMTVASVISAQDKYFIFFTDKGPDQNIKLLKRGEIELLASKYLSKRSVERRIKSLGENFLSDEDLPIYEKYLRELKNTDIKIENKSKWFNSVSAYLSIDQVKELKKYPFIKSIEKVKKLKNVEPKDSKTSVTNNLLKKSENHFYDYGVSFTQNNLSDIPIIHDMGITGEGVIIGLIDSGFDWKEHDALKNRKVIAEYDFVNKDDITENEKNDVSISQHNHGTSVFSILAGFSEGNLIGPAFNSSFLLAKTEFIPTETHAEEDNYVAALEWMDSIGVDITSSSLGYSEFDEPEFSYTYSDMDGKTTIVTKAAEMAFQKGIIVITSAGNEGDDPWYYITAPGDGFNTITVGAVSSSNKVMAFSSRGPSSDGRVKPEIVAMGSDVINAIAGTSFGFSSGSGTSYSAPIVAGIAGLLMSHYPHLTNEQVRSIIMESGDNSSNPNYEVGYGLISASSVITYPNISIEQNNFIVNKTFIDTLIEKSSSVLIEYIIGEEDEKNVSDLFESERGIYKFQLPIFNSDSVKFAYTLLNSSGSIIHRDPAEGFYCLENGELIISKNIIAPVYPTNVIDKITLFQNYPNPFNPNTTIEYSIPEGKNESKVTLTLYNILGEKVRTLVNTLQGPGNYPVQLSSIGLSSGVYFYHLKVGDFQQIKKLIVLK